MKFIFADSLDFVDPEYDFQNDRNGLGRRVHEHDQFPHEHLDIAPYDGILVSRSIVGSAGRPGKYTESQCMRFSREGARNFLRYPLSRFPNSIVMGDCGAFSYRNLSVPPYSVADTLEFYEDGGFTHGCSVDHVIFAFDDYNPDVSAEMRHRYEITLDNAHVFIRNAKRIKDFTPIGVIQGWSPKTMGSAARQLTAMGYRYLALGGLVPLRMPQIIKALEAVREEISPSIQLHLLGFGKTDHLDLVRSYGVASFDTTSPLLRAFKDGTRNYYALHEGKTLDYYIAIRIPQAIDNPKLLRRAKRGRLDQERLLRMERQALDAVRQCGMGNCSASDAVNSVIAYGQYALWDDRLSDEVNERRLTVLRSSYLRTLTDRAWERCNCRVCRELGVETLIFRSSNRNKRRGLHNLYVFYESLRALDMVTA